MNGSHVELNRSGSRSSVSDRDWNGAVLATTLAGIFITQMLRVQTDGHVSWSGNSSSVLPDLCLFHSWFGLKCPGCGLTRSVIMFMQGHLVESLAWHRLGWLMVCLALFQIPYRIVMLTGRWNTRRAPEWFRWIPICVVILLIANWLADLVRFT